MRAIVVDPYQIGLDNPEAARIGRLLLLPSPRLPNRATPPCAGSRARRRRRSPRTAGLSVLARRPPSTRPIRDRISPSAADEAEAERMLTASRLAALVTHHVARRFQGDRSAALRHATSGVARALERAGLDTLAGRRAAGLRAARPRGRADPRPRALAARRSPPPRRGDARQRRRQRGALRAPARRTREAPGEPAGPHPRVGPRSQLTGAQIVGQSRGSGSSCEPDEARGSPLCPAYSLYVERRGRPSNEVWRSKLTHCRALRAWRRTGWRAAR